MTLHCPEQKPPALRGGAARVPAPSLPRLADEARKTADEPSRPAPIPTGATWSRKTIEVASSRAALPSVPLTDTVIRPAAATSLWNPATVYRAAAWDAPRRCSVVAAARCAARLAEFACLRRVPRTPGRSAVRTRPIRSAGVLGRDVQLDQRGTAVGQVTADAAESRFGCAIVRKQVENGPGHEDRLEPARQVERLHPLVVERDSDTFLVRPTSAARQHVRGGIDALDVEAAPAQSVQRVTVSTAQLQCGTARFSYEGRIGLGVLRAGLQRGVGLRNDAGVEIGWIHGRAPLLPQHRGPVIFAVYSADASAGQIRATSEYGARPGYTENTAWSETRGEREAVAAAGSTPPAFPSRPRVQTHP